MNPHKMDKELHKRIDSEFTDFKSYCQVKQGQEEYETWHESLEFVESEEDTLEFKLLSHHFCFTKELNATQNLAIIRAHEKLIDKNDYPKCKLEEIPELDILFPHLQLLRFVLPKTAKKKIAGQDDITTIMSFPLRLVSHTIEYIEKKEAKEMEKLNIALKNKGGAGD